MVQKEKWYAWDELLKKWDKKDFELLMLFKEGLQPYKKPGFEQIHCPLGWHEYNFLLKEYSRLNNLLRVLTNCIYEDPRGEETRRKPLPFPIDDFTIAFLEKKAPDILTPEVRRAVDFPIPADRIEKLREECQKDLNSLTAKMEQIVKGDPNLNNDQSALKWEYFRLPASEREIEKLMKDLEIEKAYFRQADVLRIKEELPQSSLKDERAQEVKNEDGKGGEKSKSQEFVFKKAGPGWEIVFNGKKISPLKQTGFSYFHYCIELHPKEFSNADLWEAVNAGDTLPVSRNHLPIENHPKEDFEEESEGFYFGRIKAIAGRQDLSDPKAMVQIKNLLKELVGEREEAEGNDDFGLVDKLKEEEAKAGHYIEECQRMGRFKIFRDEGAKVSDRVNKAMGRALEELKVHSEEAFAHFYQAFKPIYSSTKQYRPTQKPNWILE